METFSALLAICAGNSPVTGEFPTQRPVTRSFDDFLICVWINGWENNREASDLRCYRTHYDVIVMSMQHGPISDDNTYCTGLKEHINGLRLDCSNSIANALELLQSCTMLSIYARVQIDSRYISHTILMTSWQRHPFCLNGLVWVRIYLIPHKVPLMRSFGGVIGEDINHQVLFEIYVFEFTATSPCRHWVNARSLGKQTARYSVTSATYLTNNLAISQIAKFLGPTWGPPGSCRPQMGPMLAPWTLLSGIRCNINNSWAIVTDRLIGHNNGPGVCGGSIKQLRSSSAHEFSVW